MFSFFTFKKAKPPARKYAKRRSISPEQKELLRVKLHARLEHFNTHYNYSYKRVFIRNQRTRWGSCSNKANLNFNIYMLKLPDELFDYIVVHELCHLKEFNHAQAFWDLVGQTMPEWQMLRAALKRIQL